MVLGLDEFEDPLGAAAAACSADQCNGFLPHTCMSKSMGYLFISFSVIMFGTNFVPVKQYKTGDGMFFQLVMCTGVWITGLIVNLVRHANGGTPAFEPLAMLGGAMWATGNVLCVAIIKTIGLGMGMLIWGACNMLKGWATGSFGFFWPKDTGIDTGLNFPGVACCCVALGLFVMVKPETGPAKSEKDEFNQEEPLIDDEEDEEDTWVDRLEGPKKINLGIGMAVVAGLLFGSCFDPATYVMKHNCSPGDPLCYDDKGHCLKSRPNCDLYGVRYAFDAKGKCVSPSSATGTQYKCAQYERGSSSSAGLDYVFSQFCGIYIASVFWMLAYCVAMNNKPKLYPEVVFPGFISGVMWAIAQFSWFVSNECLQYSVSFPLTTGGPGYIASAIGIYYGEISGRRNFQFLSVSLCFQVVGFILISLSNKN
jgi:glucose uptake protein GlcU